MEKALGSADGDTRRCQPGAYHRRSRGPTDDANELADELDVGYKTIRHHMEQLEDHDVVESGDEEYAELYFLTDRFDNYRDTFEEIVEKMDE